MFTKDICPELNQEEELPFGAYRKGDGIDSRGLAGALKPYNIKPKSIESGGENAKGYRREWFEDAWRRYAPDENVRAQEAVGDASGASGRQDEPGGGFAEPKTDLTDSETPSVRDASGPDSASQSQDGDGPDGLTLLTDTQALAGAHNPAPLATRREEAEAERVREKFGEFLTAAELGRQVVGGALASMTNTIEGTAHEVEDGEAGCPSHPDAPVPGCRYCGGAS
jgi:hypothetical protein